MTKNEDYEDTLCGVLLPCSLGFTHTDREAYGQVALIVDDVGKTRGLQLFPL